MRTSNPTLNEKTFSNLRASGNVMTVQGAAQKTFGLIFVVICGAAFTWDLVGRNSASGGAFAIGGAIAGLILCFVTIFKKEWSPITAPLYALAEGLFLGAVSAIYAAKFHGIVLQAVGITFGVALSLMLVYQTGIIRATEKFKMGIVAATGGIFLLYMASWILGMFNVQIPFIHENSLVGIGFSVAVVIIAALNLILDFDLIEQGAEMGAPKYMEWYGAFALLVTLVWLYIEVLRLLSKLNSRR
jgi:uncharacterized YccA/Bax inhibitor family protein